MGFKESIIRGVGEKREKGLSRQEIANHFKLSVTQVEYILKKHHSNRNKQTQISYTIELVNAVKKAHNKGLSRKEIASTLKLATKQVDYVLKKYYPNRNKRTNNTYDNDMIEKINKLRLKGLTYAEIAHNLSITEGVVHRIVKKHLTGNMRCKYSNEFIQQVKNLRGKGLSMRAIGNEVNAARHTVRHIVDTYITGAKRKRNSSARQTSKSVKKPRIGTEERQTNELYKTILQAGGSSLFANEFIASLRKSQNRP